MRSATSASRAVKLQIDGCRERAIERQRGEVGDGKAADFDGERLRPQALAAADRAGRGRHEVHHVLAVAVAARFVDGVAQVGEDAVEAGARRFALGRPVDQDVLLLGRQVFEGRLEVDLVAFGGKVDELEQVLRGGAGAEAAVEQRLRPVGDDLGGVEVVERAEAVALRAGAEGGVEARSCAARAWARRGRSRGRPSKRKTAARPAARRPADEDKAVGELEGLGDGLLEALFDGGLAAWTSFCVPTLGCAKDEAPATRDVADSSRRGRPSAGCGR